ncbi:hypothetical protein ECC02_011490 [Trypanosoma cruzi]|uniref:Secreted protein n=1 Tax=Trypanosoma cruzi TaxID=5693 RepID=A0A7J6XMQ6_TRYCR|nr:hypothetical protein ECC02_011490 [Trypanosoma cruzi]
MCVWVMCVLFLVLSEPSNFTVAIRVWLLSFLACLRSRSGEENNSGSTSERSVRIRAEQPRSEWGTRQSGRNGTENHRTQKTATTTTTRRKPTHTNTERDMQAEFYYSATPFKVLPKQPASDTVISHTLPVHRRGNDADTNGNMCTNVGGTNSQHRHTTLALSVHPTSRPKSPRQAPINKIMRRRKQLPCRPFRAPQQHHQQERASLCLQQCRPLCSWPLGALNTSPTISRSQSKPHADAIHFLRKWCCRAQSCANNPQHITQSSFPLPQKKKTKMF